ncbi:MAG TPA: hypothetical protein VFW71_16400 [Actinomycetota bacterium]|nr:hypothetical protein [Actinomycetota bacterium]
MLISATRPIGLPTRSHLFPEDRICSHPGCATRLCIYNRQSTCYLHTTPTAPRLRGRKPARRG